MRGGGLHSRCRSRNYRRPSAVQYPMSNWKVAAAANMPPCLGERSNLQMQALHLVSIASLIFAGASSLIILIDIQEAM